MQLTKEFFSEIEHKGTAKLFTLRNDDGLQVTITNYGGIITGINAPDKNGRFENICLGFDEADDYFSSAYHKARPYFGAIIGRYANRIANGSFTINGEVYKFAKNNGNNTLHGGIDGFDKKIWAFETEEDNNSVRLILNYTSPDGEEGFPGNIDVKVVYELNNQNELKIHYQAVSDKPTHVNLTNHTYFNLTACHHDILNHSVRINADYYSEVDKETIPTGKSSPVDGTCMDFRKSQQISKRINEVEGNCYDHNYELNNYDGNLRFVAEAIDHESGRKLEVYSTEPGMQFYTANWLDGSLNNKDKVFSKRMAFCFETQHYPDTPNQPNFPSTLLKPGEQYNSTTIYKFSVVD